MFLSESSILDDAINPSTDEQVADNENADAEGDDDQAEFHAEESTEKRLTISPRWPTRVFAAKCVRSIITTCANDKQTHFDLTFAKEMQHTKGKGWSKLFRLKFCQLNVINRFNYQKEGWFKISFCFIL